MGARPESVTKRDEMWSKLENKLSMLPLIRNPCCCCCANRVPFPLPDDRRCIKTRPISDLNGKVSAALAEWSNTRLASVRQPHVVVVGGGAAGVELAFSTYARARLAAYVTWTEGMKLPMRYTWSQAQSRTTNIRAAARITSGVPSKGEGSTPPEWGEGVMRS